MMLNERRPRAHIVAALGRRRTSVQAKVHELGRTFAHHDRRNAERAERHEAIRELVARGKCAADIARELGECDQTIRHNVKLLGLQDQLVKLTCADAANRGRAATERIHYASPIELRHQKERFDALAIGWSPVTARMARHLQLWYDHGPASRAEHAQRAGISNDGAEGVLAKMRAAGVLVPTGRRRRYDLAPEVRESRRAFLATVAPDPD